MTLDRDEGSGWRREQRAVGYRRYRREQLDRARTIGWRRELDLPLAEIGRLLGAPDELARRQRLERPRLRLEARLARTQHALHHIRQFIDRKELAVTRPSMPPELDPATHRRLASGLYNLTWTLIEKADRSADETDRMIHAAHASRHHWEAIGLPANRARGEWLCSRVYATVGRPEPALWHARRCLEILEAGGEGIEDWDLPAAYEGLTRAYALGGNQAQAEHYRDIAREAASRISEAEDRELIEGDIATIPV